MGSSRWLAGFNCWLVVADLVNGWLGSRFISRSCQVFFWSAQLGDPALTHLLLLRPQEILSKFRCEGGRAIEGVQIWDLGILSAKLDYHQVPDTLRNKPMPGQHRSPSESKQNPEFSQVHVRCWLVPFFPPKDLAVQLGLQKERSNIQMQMHMRYTWSYTVVIWVYIYI
jgi:hypothetical protein